MQEELLMKHLTCAARHVALDFDLSLHVRLHQNSLQNQSGGEVQLNTTVKHRQLGLGIVLI